LPTRL